MRKIDRLDMYLKSKGLNDNRITNELGLTVGVIGKSRKEGRDLSDKVVELILNFYTDLNRVWLLTGEGEMLRTEKKAEANPSLSVRKEKSIRYWVDIDATGGDVELFNDTCSDRTISLNIPEFSDCTDACNLYGDSMFPMYQSGQIIILKEWRENYIEFGKVYLIVTKGGNRMVKRIRKGSNADSVICESENPKYDPFEINKCDIVRLFAVKGSITKNEM